MGASTGEQRYRERAKLPSYQAAEFPMPIPRPMLTRLRAMAMRDGETHGDGVVVVADEMLLALGRTVAMAMRDTDGDARWRW
jgi:hypothetical protein